jgi:anti-sigma B factor antagonist
MLTVEEKQRGPVTILRIGGDLRQEECRQMQQAIRRLLNEKKPWIILEMSGITYIGSHALGILLFADQEAREQEGRIKLLRPHKVVIWVLQATRTKFLLEVFHDEEAAVASFGALSRRGTG